ncbi:unnamed protein product [Cylicocyclus nassatus]|uniref:Uncharacterized protein n=1 Tax=Cylicocyclus nassatus TaxID=53992 RepID=A0AA36HB80_CYLNA|nr:unnamed protein product [Cylicocyclus nassatus]
MASRSVILAQNSVKLLNSLEAKRIHFGLAQCSKIRDVGDKAQGVVGAAMEKVSKAGEAIKEKVAPAGQGNRFMEETGYENAKEAAASARDATQSGKGTYEGGVRQTEKDIRRETERRMEHAKKVVEEKVDEKRTSQNSLITEFHRRPWSQLQIACIQFDKDTMYDFATAYHRITFPPRIFPIRWTSAGVLFTNPFVSCEISVSRSMQIAWTLGEEHL